MIDKEIYYIEIICIIFLILFLALLFYNVTIPEPVKEIENESDYVIPKKEIKISNHDVKVRCPPKLINLYNEDIKQLPNKNDINIINKSRINLYNNNNLIDNPNFNKEIITQESIKTKKDREFDPELEKVYTTDLAENNNPNIDYNQIFDYSVKPNKSDLPMVNMPACYLKSNSRSFKLSDKLAQL
tara:strand:+ start:6694 stop:7251 length:558 start_codon:yes stop_codon:yes gene_type:complete